MDKSNHSCEEELQNARLKITPARIAALKLFESHTRPVDAQHIFSHIKNDPGVNRVTVFRVLNTFTEKGLIKKLSFGENKSMYELNISDHHHLICQRCGVVEDIENCDLSAIEDAIKKNKRFQVINHSLEFFGICINCQN